ncbi:Coproheme decarboxylase HemQ (no EC) [hydrothermal vent metagenome]|uniref:Coproheme decarboxylase HemQ (No EC) n=1 Tax=hydrothermal vent metagenome TaxID=652676 RepID=A0A3B1DND5_9ZZZZ
MNRPTRPAAANLPEPTIKLKEGWHCLHLYYQVDQSALDQLAEEELQEGREELIEILNPERENTPERIQTSVVSGAGADLGLMIMDPDPLVIDSIMQQVRSSILGVALLPTYSFVSITEISEYVPTLEQFTEKLIREGADSSDPAFQARVDGYEKRLPMMNKQRLYPDFPDLPVMSFYPMNKIRHPQANWYMEPFSSRSAMMSEHATSGIKFAGRISQLITASTGFDDWEWGVTLWGRSPEDIKEIVYTMRFDEASARYAEFGPFYISYMMSPADAIAHLRM